MRHFCQKRKKKKRERRRADLFEDGLDGVVDSTSTDALKGSEGDRVRVLGLERDLGGLVLAHRDDVLEGDFFLHHQHQRRKKKKKRKRGGQWIVIKGADRKWKGKETS